MRASIKTLRQFIRIICAMSLILLSFAHQPMAMTQNETSFVDLTAYTLPDGTVLALCLSGGSNENPSFGGSCEFCRIASSVALPLPSGEFEPNRLSVSVAFVVSGEMDLVCAAFPPAAPPRGPPTLHI